MDTSTVPAQADNTPITPQAPPAATAAVPIAAPAAAAPAAPSGDWRAALPEDLRNNNSLQKFTTIEGLAKSYVNVEKMIPAEKWIIPRPGDTQAENEAFTKLGRPEQPDGYALDKPQLPEGLPYDEEGEKKFRQWAHMGGMSQHRANEVWQGVVADRLEQINQAMRSYEQEKVQADLSLKKELGTAYDQYMTAAKTAMNEYGGEELVNYLNETGLGNHPSLIKAFGRIGRELVGAGKLKGEQVTTQTPVEAQASLAEFRAKHKVALYEQSHPEHTARLAQLTQMTEQAFGKQLLNQPI